MNKQFSPEMINFLADRMHQFVLETDKRIDEVFHDLNTVEASLGYSHLREKVGEARALRDQLSRVLFSIENDLRQQAQITSEMMEVYAPPNLMGKSRAASGLNDEVYPNNYQSSAQDDEETIKEPDWRDGDTLWLCNQCHNSVPANTARCPYCGAILNYGKMVEMNKLYASPEVYASPRILNSLRSVFSNILSKKGE